MNKFCFTRTAKQLDELWVRYIRDMQAAGVVCEFYGPTCRDEWKRSASGEFLLELDFSQWSSLELLMARDYDYYDGMFKCVGWLGLSVTRHSDGKHFISRA